MRGGRKEEGRGGGGRERGGRRYQLVEGMLELLQTVDKLVFARRFGAQRQDALWWTQNMTEVSLFN